MSLVIMDNDIKKCLREVLDVRIVIMGLFL